MEIHKTTIKPGERRIIRIPVGRLATGNQIKIVVQIFRTAKPGPVVLLSSGLHGDEVNGVEILRQSLALGIFDALHRGSVIVLPVANPHGFAHGIRGVPDGKDINRSFPGNRKGSLAARTARILSTKILPLIDFGVDFHTGGGQHYNYPQIRFTGDDERARRLALEFSAPFALVKIPISKSFRGEAAKMGKPLLIYEGGESSRYDSFTIARGLAGIQRLLQSQDMLPPDSPQTGTLILENSSWIRAPRTGMFECVKRAGQRVREGEILGNMNDPYGQESLPVTAPRGGFLIGHNNAAVVYQGDALFHLGY